MIKLRRKLKKSSLNLTFYYCDSKNRENYQKSKKNCKPRFRQRIRIVGYNGMSF